MKNLLMTQLL